MGFFFLLLCIFTFNPLAFLQEGKFIGKSSLGAHVMAHENREKTPQFRHLDCDC